MDREAFDPDKISGAQSAQQPVDPVLERLAKEVIGAAIAVHRELGPGFPESVYEKSLALELGLRNVKAVSQAPVTVSYKGSVVGEGRIDLLVEGRLIVELKTVESFTATHPAQVVAYLRARGERLGLLINFNVPVLKSGLKRIIL